MAGKKRVYKRRARRGPTLAKRVAKLEKVSVPETKWQEAWDISNATNVFCEFDNTPANCFDEPLLVLGQGTGQHQRVGNQVKIKSFYGRMTLNAPTGAPGRLFRFVLYIPRNVEDRLSEAVGGTNPLKNLDQIDPDRFSVLMDKSYHIAPTHGSLGNVKQIVLAKKFKRYITQYYDTQSALSVKKNDLRLYIVSTQGTGSSQKSYIQGYMKTYFIDP